STKLSFTFDDSSSVSKDQTSIALSFLFFNATDPHSSLQFIFHTSFFFFPFSSRLNNFTLPNSRFFHTNEVLAVSHIVIKLTNSFSVLSLGYFVKSSTFIFLKHCYLLISSSKNLLNLVHLSRFVPVVIGESGLLQGVYIKQDKPQNHH
ncbi:unnamed protein product, partial [Arabidopsis halleri]